MTRRLLPLFLLLAANTLVLADTTNSPIKIGATEAAAHYVQTLTVTGLVAQVTLRPSIIFIILDQPYPDSPFAAVIHSKDTNQFGNLKQLKGKAVELTGKVVKFHDRPEMLLEKPGQIFVLGGWATNAPAAATPSGGQTAPSQPAGTNDLTKGIL